MFILKQPQINTIEFGVPFSLTVIRGTGYLTEGSRVLIWGKSRYRTFVADAFAPLDSVPAVVSALNAPHVTLRSLQREPTAFILSRDAFILTGYAALVFWSTLHFLS